MINNNIEIQPVRVETPNTTEIPNGFNSVETVTSTPVGQESKAQEILPATPKASVGVEVTTEVLNKPSAGFPINPEDTGTSRIVLEKIIGKIENL
ncbi:MAG: hypothetical protein PHR67_08020 [Candidatus Cloacimonetes bacterium]|nr:hypothetical protein [Candidatus Cloacimonadota bacterium]